jgi:hypothetical protein
MRQPAHAEIVADRGAFSHSVLDVEVAHASACRSGTRAAAWFPRRRHECRRCTLKRAPHRIGHQTAKLAIRQNDRERTRRLFLCASSC